MGQCDPNHIAHRVGTSRFGPVSAGVVLKNVQNACSTAESSVALKRVPSKSASIQIGERSLKNNKDSVVVTLCSSYDNQRNPVIAAQTDLKTTDQGGILKKINWEMFCLLGAEIGKGMSTEKQFSEPSGSLNGPDLFTELPFL